MKKVSILFGILISLLLFGVIGTSASVDDFGRMFVDNRTNTPTQIILSTNLEPIDLTHFKVSTPLLIPPSPSGEYLVIIVENALWANAAVQTAINTYRIDLNNTGYNTILYTTTIANVQILRTLLQNWYTTNNIIGAVLIGNLPYARYYHPANGSFSAETFICDLFLMDLDGLWWDTNTDTIYDRHNASMGGDIYPEIYVGRIDASTRTLGGTTNANDIIMLLNRIHSYRIGGVARSHRALTYIDDDWQWWADGTYDNWPAWLNNAYSVRTDVHTPTTWTNATDWLNNRITQDYEWTHICAHSSAGPGVHFFGPGGSGEGTVTSAQIHSQSPTFNFYNLFCCHGADWLTTDSLATTYLYSGSHSVAVIGSSKTGGMLDGSSFYNTLGQNETLGKAFENWFQGIKNYATYYLEWFYGMCILGDPFLTTHYDVTALPPVISSITHPNQTQWYSNSLPQFSWTTPPDVNGVSGYYYILDNNPSTIPTSATGSYTTGNLFTPPSSLTDGQWYLHIVANDTLGNVGTEAAHYQVNIDTTGPSTKLTSPIVNFNSSSNFVSISWSATDTGIGYLMSSVWLDNTFNIYGGPNLSYIATGLTQGPHLLNVTTMDYLMNTQSTWVNIYIDLTDPLVNITSHSNGDLVSSSFMLQWTASDGETGYHYAEVYIDNILTQTVHRPAMSAPILGLLWGAHTLKVTIYDWSGRTASSQVSVIVQSFILPGVPGFPIEAIAIGAILAFGLGLVHRRRKQSIT